MADPFQTPEQVLQQVREALAFYANPTVYEADSTGRRLSITFVAENAIASIDAALSLPAAAPTADTRVDGGALRMALNVLRRAGKDEVADALEKTAVRGLPAAAVPTQQPVAWTVAGEITDWSRDFSAYRTQTYVRPVFASPAPAAAPEQQQQDIRDGSALSASSPSAAVSDLNALMAEHRISVWMDPDWWEGSALPRWLAGKNIRAVEGTYYSTLTGSDPSSIEADDTCNGATPLEAVLAVIAKETA